MGADNTYGETNFNTEKMKNTTIDSKDFESIDKDLLYLRIKKNETGYLINKSNKMTRKEQIIEILERWITETDEFPDCIMKHNFSKVADALVALEINTPIGLDCEIWKEKDKKYLIDKEVFTKGELDQRLLGRWEGMMWMKDEILKLNS